MNPPIHKTSPQAPQKANQSPTHQRASTNPQPPHPSSPGGNRVKEATAGDEPQQRLASQKQASQPSPDQSPKEKSPTPIEEKLIRLQADFANYQKRVAKEQATWFARANEKLLLALIPVINDFQRALKALPQHEANNQTLQGIQLIHEKLLKTLAKQGVVPMSVAIGNPIDNEDQVEVVSMLPVEEADKKGKILQIVEQGYLYHGHTLQRAQVIIGQ